ncbi:MAG TPA: cysteine desulfurase family protein [Candidatus Xenobia bacterium]|jgi:cysteine desulfurase
MTSGYFDYAATTPMAPEVLEAMQGWMTTSFGNPSSVHAWGRRARQAVERARGQVARLIGAAPDEIVFTSGGTEADNLAMLGACRSGRVLMSAVEHHAVLETRPVLEALGCTVDLIPVDAGGQLADFEWPSDTCLLSCMLVNNETGTRLAVAALAAQARRRGVLVHTDAVQAVGIEAVDVQELGVDLLSMSAHKIYGPQGVGALYVRGVSLQPRHVGGPQEDGRRAGTENVAAVVGMGEAAALAWQHRAERRRHLEALSERFLSRLPPDAQRLGADPVPSIHCIQFPGVDGEALLIRLDLEGIAASLGAACSSGAVSPSHVLLAMGLSKPEAWSALRFSMGQGTTRGDVDRLTKVLARVVPTCRK